MSWLVRDGDVLAAAEQATTFGDRLRGLWHRPEPVGALVMRPPFVLHTVGLRYPVEVAFCDENMVVLATRRLSRFRVARPRMRVRRLVIAADGAFERWHLAVGDTLEVSGPEVNRW